MHDPSVIFSDGCIKDPQLLKTIFPATALLLCCFHIFSFDIPGQLKNKPCWNSLELLLLKLRDISYVSGFDDLWSTIQTQFPAVVRYHHTVNSSYRVISILYFPSFCFMCCFVYITVHASHNVYSKRNLMS